ncbi:MAG: radical SAM protein [Burkholderiales bacterium]|nr:radical SAM protein [Burkholderiales bacterium]
MSAVLPTGSALVPPRAATGDAAAIPALDPIPAPAAQPVAPAASTPVRPAAAAGDAGVTDTLTPPLPRFAQIEPIGRCNLACRMCTVNDRGDEVAELPFERFVELIDQMPTLQELHLQGLGEPMLHPRFFDMVELAAARGIRVSANTNLTLLTESRARRCVTSGLAALSVSLDGASAGVYESIRLKASFAKVLRNLDRLVAARRQAGSALHIRGVMVLMRHNLAELLALIELLHRHGVPELLVQRLSSDLTQPDLPRRYIPIRDYVAHAELSDADLPQAAQVFEQSRALARRLGLKLCLPKLQPAAAASERGASIGSIGAMASPAAAPLAATASAAAPPAAPASAAAPAVAASGSSPASSPTRPAGPRCTWPWDQLYLTAAGELLPCCMVATADRASFGKVFAQAAGQGASPPAAAQAASPLAAPGAASSPAAAQASTGLLDRWHGSTAQAFRQALGTDQPPAVCRSCALYHGTF